jgi:hypothetical protein
VSTISGPGAIFLDGGCSFLTCIETGPHGHDVCRDCDTVRFANMNCRNCVTHADWPDDFRALLLAMLDRDGS